MRGLEKPAEEIVECSRCLLDNTDTEEIYFDEEGVCNYCRYYDKCIEELGKPEERKVFLEKKIEEIKAAGKGKKYDCILGLSGGVDSSYMALKAKEFGLRPLVVHLDNGWNSDIAVSNIEKICEKLDFELHTHVIDWEEFVAMQRAYLKAGVIDIEVLTDHAIAAVIKKFSIKYGLKYSLSGFNYVTEAIMPKGWVYNKLDFRNIEDIIKQFGGGVKLKTFPYVTFFKSLYYFWVLKLESFRLLNYINYRREDAIIEIKEKLEWQNYGGKHHESIFTKFYQNYILPKKFGIDKRKAHLSNIICSGVINKSEAKKILNTPMEVDSFELEYVLKKLSISNKEFNEIIESTPNSHSNFATDQEFWDKYFRLIKLLKFWKRKN